MYNGEGRLWLKGFFILMLSALSLSACDRPAETSSKPVTPRFSEKQQDRDETLYIFSIHPLHNPKRLHDIFGPLIKYLGDHIEGASFRLEASRNYDVYDQKLYARQHHFSLPNPFQTINSLEHGYRVFGKMGDDDNFRGIFLVRKDSNIREVADLKGKVVSYPAPTALAATMMPQYYLNTHGLDVMKDIENRYVGSQESSIMNVYLGDVAAGATWPPPWRALSKERPELKDKLKIIWQTPPLPNNGLVVRDDVPQAVVDQVAELLFSLHKHAEGRAMLERMELSMFEAATNETYDPVRNFVETFNNTVRPVK